ncbi:MAG: DUF898 domain-containing protein [Deltaproteobacteria bacterium]|nr:DUF898 domain-containing protein [Deltaproteobacteria bacterium]
MDETREEMIVVEHEPNQEAVISELPVTSVVPLEFRGTAGEYFKIWIVNLCLSIATLGIYSAWAKVRTKRYFYGNTFLNGVSFDYDADPVKILKGRIIIGILFGALAISQHISLTVYGVMIGVFFLIFPWFAVRALAFNARYSSYRNVRFDFKGRLSEAYKVFVALPLAIPFTLGLIYPYLKKHQVDFFMNSHRYGVRPFKFDADTKAFWPIYGAAWAMSIGLAVVFGIFITVIIAGLSASGGLLANIGDAGPDTFAADSLLFASIWVIYGIMYLAMLFIAAYIKANVTNIMWNNTRLGQHGFESRQTGSGLYKIYLTNLFAVVFTAGLAMPWAMIRLAKYKADCLTVWILGDLDVKASKTQQEIGAAGDAALDLGDFDFDLGL